MLIGKSHLLSQSLNPFLLRVLVISIFLLTSARHYAAADTLKNYNIKFFKAIPIETAPILDGIISQGEWPVLAGGDFTLTGNFVKARATQQTIFTITFDSAHLYIAIFSSEKSINQNPNKFYQPDDEHILLQDRIEVFIDPQHDHRNYFQFVVSRENNELDSKIIRYLPNTRTHHHNRQWNARWLHFTSVSDSGWSVEMAIPFSELGIQYSSELTSMGFNIGRARYNHSDPDVNPEYSAWKWLFDGIWETPSDFYEPIEFGDLSFKGIEIDIKSLAFPNAAFNGPVGEPPLAGENPLTIFFKQIKTSRLIAQIKVATPVYHSIISDTSTLQTDYHSNTILDVKNNELHTSFTVLRAGENKLTIKLLDPLTFGQVYQASYILLVPPFLKLDLEEFYAPAPKRGPVVGYQLMCSQSLLQQTNLEIQLIDERHNVFSTITCQPQDKNVFIDLPLSYKTPLKPGNYIFIGRLVDKISGKVQVEAQYPFTVPDHQPAIFGARREMYNFGGLTSEAVVINFPFAARFVFAKMASYMPWWEMAGATMSNECVETWLDGVEGCAEPIQDRECRYSSVIILENTHARVKVLWRYALNDAHYVIHANEWVEEIYTFYPDGTGIRDVQLFANSKKPHEIFEAIYAISPGISTYQLFEPEILSLNTLQGSKLSLARIRAQPKLYDGFIKNNRDFIIETHFKNRLHPFTVVSLQPRTIPNSLPATISVAKSMAPDGTRRGHWPASVYPLDGYNAMGTERPGHFSLGNFHVMTSADNRLNRWLFLLGIKSKGSNDDQVYAREWISPPELLLKGLSDDSAVPLPYLREDRAYQLPSANNKQQLCLIAGDQIKNPVLAGQLKYPPKEVRVNGFPKTEAMVTGMKANGETVIFLHLQLYKNDCLTIRF